MQHAQRAQPLNRPPLPRPTVQEARALESKQRQLQAALDRAQREGRALNGQQERVVALGTQLVEAQVCACAAAQWPACWRAVVGRRGRQLADSGAIDRVHGHGAGCARQSALPNLCLAVVVSPPCNAAHHCSHCRRRLRRHGPRWPPPAAAARCWRRLGQRPRSRLGLSRWVVQLMWAGTWLAASYRSCQAAVPTCSSRGSYLCLSSSQHNRSGCSQAAVSACP